MPGRGLEIRFHSSLLSTGSGAGFQPVIRTSQALRHESVNPECDKVKLEFTFLCTIHLTLLPANSFIC